VSLPRPRLALAALAALTVAFPARAQEGDGAADPYQRTLWPLLERYCVDCHAEGTAEGGVALDVFADQAAAVADGRTWLRVLDAIEGRIMPPPDKPQPTLAEIEAMTGWIEHEYLAARRDRGRPAPAVVLRRLNRAEYDNTIQDLLGLDLKLAATSFPPDEMSFGYDNVGSALSVSPVHVEKYLDAAERAMEAAIALPEPGDLPPIELIGLRTYPLPPDGVVEFEHALKPGRYLVDFSLVRVGIPDTITPPRLVIGFGTDSRTLEAVRVQDETVVYRFWIGVREGDAKVTVRLAPGEAEGPNVRPAAVAANVSGDQRYGSQIGLHVDSMVVRGPVTLDEAAVPAAHRRILAEAPGPGDAARLEAARALVERFAARAWRRPAPADEVERVLEVFRLADARGESFERSIQVALTTVLVSPRFLYLVEPTDEPAADRPLDDYELASRLAYFLWTGPPDEALLDEAARGTLRGNLPAQVGRMLADPRSDRFVANFAGQWLQLRRLAAVNPDPSLFPGVDEGLRDAMRRETEATLAHVLRENRSALELLDADYTFVNERLAAHYGLDGVVGDEFRKVSLPDRRRGGVLTQASVLTLTSNPNRTSPVKRGQWILQQVLGTPPPPPPPDVPKLDEDKKADTASLRERLEIHRSNPACASCHSQMDPLGFSLENYDAVGRWREADGAFPVAPSGELAGGLAFADAAELKTLLVSNASKKYARALVRNLLTYALGRGLEADDFATVESIRDRLAADEYRIQTLILGIVESPAFQNRGATGAPNAPEVTER
jgi:hypothetical protein